MHELDKQTPASTEAGTHERLPELIPAPSWRGARPCFPQVRRILLCLDGSALSEQGLQPALAVARALELPLCLLHVLAERGLPHRTEPTDPMLSEIRRLEACSYLDDLCHDRIPPDLPTEVRVTQGHVVDNIIREARRDGPALVVLTRHGERGQLDHPLSSTAHEVIHRLSGPFLLVPIVPGRAHEDLGTDLGTDLGAKLGGDLAARWSTVMVPLDGSVRAECAIPAAENIACDHGAELLLFHAVPAPELSGPRPFTKQDLELADRLQERNRQAAEVYLERVRSRIASQRVAVRTLVLQKGPVRDSLAELLQREDIGLVVACAHGATGSQSWKFGGLAAHLIENSNCALLLIQDLSESSMRRLTHRSIGARGWTARDLIDRLQHR